MIFDLWHIMPSRLHDEIKKISVASHMEDKLIFSPSVTGIFSTRKYGDLLRECGPKRVWAQWIWQKFLPPNVSAFLWKIFRHALPVDARVREKRIYLVSRCRCYLSYAEETSSHLFIHSEIAARVWNHFAKIFRVTNVYGSILHALSTWIKGRSSSTQYGMCRLGTAAYILREIWVARCQATYEDIPMNSNDICRKVVWRVQNLNLIHFPKKKSSPIHTHIMGIIGISPKPVTVHRVLWCKWERPDSGWFKLNIDGASGLMVLLSRHSHTSMGSALIIYPSFRP